MRRLRQIFAASALISTLGTAACTSGASRSATSPAASSPSTSPAASSSHSVPVSRWQHVVIVIEENRDAGHIIDSPDAPYINSLSRAGVTFTDMHGETHPSEPNYVALLSGSTRGLTDDSCPHTYPADNVAAQLIRKGMSFTGYSESLPSPGYSGCDAYPYARRHVPWTDFSNLPPSVNQPLTAMPADYEQLPTVAVVIPNVVNDMHDGSVRQGDAWLRKHLAAYVTWAQTHHSLFLLTWDEDEGSSANHIATVAVGDGLAAGTWTQHADHYSILAGLERSFGLPLLGEAAHASVAPIG